MPDALEPIFLALRWFLRLALLVMAKGTYFDLFYSNISQKS
jgi:hypothetical protein